MRKVFITALIALSLGTLSAQTSIKTKEWEWKISKDGVAKQLIFKSGNQKDTIPFFVGKANDGPSFYLKVNGEEKRGKWLPNGRNSYRTNIDGISCQLTYCSLNHSPAIQVTMCNESLTTFQPQKAGLKLGVDTYMEKYPQWFGKYFPTLMRCEKTHFYGYMQTPGKHTLALVCQQPIASWSVDYNLGYMDPAPHWFMGHRIESLNLDLINQLPLPQHHPQHLYELKKGESKTWTISFINVGDLAQLESSITKVSPVPLIVLDKTSYKQGDVAQFEVIAKHPQIKVYDEQGANLPIQIVTSKAKTQVKCTLPNIGFYKVIVNSDGKESEAIIAANHSWQWVMEQARVATMKYHQKATSHAESWYGFYSAFIAAKHFPNKELDKQVSDRFDYLYRLLHDTVKVEPKYYGSRIQNTSTTIGMLVDKYEAQGSIEDLRKASQLADWLIANWQRKDGAYCNHGTIYTSVIYIAKSILELAVAEEQLAQKDASWTKAYLHHYDSAKRAIDQLVNSRGDFQTEGELTFEDGMISCSALQIGMLATLEKTPESKKKYTDAMLDILNSHDCLTQLKVPDARRRQGTMRFWEAQYDVQMLPNMFNSPHGWSGWRAYATYYAYLLTGNEKWLRQTFNAMGAFANLINYTNGELRWAFVVDPHLEVEQACSADTKVTADSLSFGNPHPRLYDTRKFVIGEQYVNMISDWQTVNTQDNDVHELFKCMGETVLLNAFVVERADGTFEGYNCKVTKQNDTLIVTAHEKQIVNLHCNITHPLIVKFGTKEQRLPAHYCNWAFTK